MSRFTCDSNAYQVYIPSSAPAGTNSIFVSIDTATGAFTFISADMGYNINAIGYNTLDNYIYGMYKNNTSNTFNLLRIESDASVTDLGPLNGIPPTGGLNVGCFDDAGFYYIKKASQPNFYVIDLRPGSPTYMDFVDSTANYTVIPGIAKEITYSPGIATEGDWTFNMSNGVLYAGQNAASGSMVAINPRTGVLTLPTILTPGFPTTYGGMFSDANGFIYGIDNATGRIIRWSVSSSGLSGQQFTNTTPTQNNDACSCVNAVIEFDFGDCPDTGSGNGPGNYNTLLENNGPRHGNNDNLRLGSTITLETDAHQNSTATGDVDDAVATPITVKEGSTSLSIDVNYTNNTGSDAYIYAWIDYKRDGIFSQDESVTPTTVSSSGVNPRTVNITFALPNLSVLSVGRNSFIRIRIVSTPLTNTNSSNVALEDTRSIGPATFGEVEDYEVIVSASTPFECNRFAYRVSAVSSSANSQLERIDTVTGNVTIINPNIGYNVNAIGYNTIDNYIYGITQINNLFYLVKIASNGTTINLGQINGLPSGLVALNVGACDNNGYFYFKKASGANSDVFYVMNVNPNSPDYLRFVNPGTGYTPAIDGFSTPIVPNVGTGGDWSFNLSDGLLYAANQAGTGLLTINPITGASANVTISGSGVTDFSYGACFTDAKGFFYGISNSTGAIYRFRSVGVGVMSGTLFSQSVPSSSTDAAFCLDATIDTDFGDCPDNGSGIPAQNNYNTLLSSDGPRHGVTSELLLGQRITSEDDAYQNSSATGDDIIKGIQDDGVSPVPPIYVGATTYTLPLVFTNYIGADAQIYGWVDFNKNGIFEINEGAIITAKTGGQNPQQGTLTFNVPGTSNLANGDTTFIRLRITTDPLINSGAFVTSQDTRSIGPASNGEVEDYIVSVLALQISGFVWYDSNCNGLFDTGEPLAPNVVVELYNSNNLATPIASTTTDVTGTYVFNNLMPGNYVVKVISPYNSYGFTQSNIGSNPAINSNVNSETGISQVITLGENLTSQTANSGLCRCNNVSGTVFYDCGKNGTLQFKNSLLCGVRVNLLDSSNNIIGTTITDCKGYYQFNCVSADSYNVQFVPPPGMSFSTPPASTVYYGSKPNQTTGIAPVVVTTTDVINIFAGVYGSLSMDLKYCSNDNDCSCNPDLNNPGNTGCNYCK